MSSSQIQENESPKNTVSDEQYLISNNTASTGATTAPGSPVQAINQTRDATNSQGFSQQVRQRTRSVGMSREQTWRELLRPPKKVEATTTGKSLKSIITATWLNVLLVCIPISWAMHFSKQSDVLIFVFSFLAIVPLAKLRGFATEELSIRVGKTLGGLLHATLGNAVGLIVAIIALTQCKLTLVQSSLVGSILSNILLVLGTCFFVRGIQKAEQVFLPSAANSNSSLLTLSVIAVLIPAAFLFAVDKGNAGVNSQASNSTNSTNTASGQSNMTVTPQMESNDILRMSRGAAVILLVIYISYLVFQLRSHAYLYENDDVFESKDYPSRILKIPHLYRRHHTEKPAEAATEKSQEDEDIEEPQSTVPVCIGLLIAVTVCLTFTSKFLVDSIDGVTANSALTPEWVGLILLPIVGNAAEHVTAVTVSVTDKFTLRLGVAVGSSIIALFVIPFIVVLAWILDKPLTLLFDPFQSIVLFLAVLTVNYCIQDGKSNWLEGMILLCLYTLIAVTFWFYPGVNLSAGLRPLQCPPSS